MQLRAWCAQSCACDYYHLSVPFEHADAVACMIVEHAVAVLLVQLGEKAGGPVIRECKQKQEETEQQMQRKIQQLKRAKQDRSVAMKAMLTWAMLCC